MSPSPVRRPPSPVPGASPMLSQSSPCKLSIGPATLAACLAAVWLAILAASGRAAELPPPAAPLPAKIEIAPGPFQPTWDSLGQYRCPDWFRDAKLGIWAVWGPESLPEQGDWYARNLYDPNSRREQVPPSSTTAIRRSSASRTSSRSGRPSAGTRTA